ncbi:MAG: glycosyltransferase [Paludibacteraceae bacterium]|nr:glycosyltransferase [Paludibacteraceae bacterium]
MPYFSIIIPVYNRPNEIDELLLSLTKQTYTDFEVIVVDDGSEIVCKSVVEKYKDKFSVKYYYKKNSGPGQTRNFGSEKSAGDYLLILDSDCILPKQYLSTIFDELAENPCDAFGGPDRAHSSFSAVQKAINYSMTSFFTTGGIRGGKRKMDKFYPRSFNLGVKKSVFEKLGGFSSMRFGEDIDFSIRIFKNNYSCRLFPKSWVYHKRRTDFSKFFKQVHNSGIARINLYKRYPESLKLVHLLPTIFTLGILFLFFISSFYPAFLVLILFYGLLVFCDASTKEKSGKIGLLSIVASFVQLIGYGTGFLRGVWRRLVLKQDEFNAFEHNFYK